MPTVFACIALCLTVMTATAAQAAGVTLAEDTCRQVFDNPRAEHIDCRTGFRLDDEARGKLASSSFGMVTDLTCSAAIKANRSEVIGRVRAGGEVSLPPQAVECRLVSGNAPVNVRFNLAPVVRITKGRAVDANLGIRDLTGIPEPLATAVAELLNNDPTLRKSLVAAANEIIPNLPKR